MDEATADTTGNNATEQLIWSGSSSQVRNLHIYLLCALFCWLIIPIFYGIAKWIQLRARRYELTTQRVRIRQGVFSQRMFGVGNIVITTNDASTPSVTLEALPNAADTREKLRAAIEESRDRKR